MIGLLETLFKFHMHGERVTSKDNFADLPTRKELRGKYLEELAKLEAKEGWEASWVDLNEDTVRLGWHQLHQGLEEQDWYSYAAKTLVRIELKHPGLMEKTSGVRLSEVLTALEAAATEQPIPKVFVANGDFEEKTKSEERLELTRGKVPTANQLQKKLAGLQEVKGKEEGARAFNKMLREDPTADPQRTIENTQQKQFDKLWTVLGVENKDYDPEKESIRPPTAKPKPLELGKEFRLKEPLSLLSGYSGIGSVETGFIDSGLGRVVAFAERSPGLREFLKGKHPEATAFDSVEEMMEATPRAVIVVERWPICLA